MTDIERLVAGFRDFHGDYYGPGTSDPERLRQRQRPKVMVVGCSDSRVDPAILTNSAPGDIFIVRNVANLVPPYEEEGGQHGVSAAVEFAVCNLRVEHIIVLGHSQCGGIGALMAGYRGCREGGSLHRWISMAAPARERALALAPEQDDTARRRTAEQASILLSLDNLRTFPFVAEQLDAGALTLHGWYFDLHAGVLLAYCPDTEAFQTVAG